MTTVWILALVTSVWIGLHPWAVLAQQSPVQIYRLYVDSEVAFRFATTNVTSYLANTGSTPQEVEFKVTLPEAAFIANFSMVIDGQLYPGNVKEKQAAQKQYERAKKKGQSAGQVKAKSAKQPNVFQIQVNVAAQKKVEFSLTYQELLQRRLGLYENVINIDPGQVVRDLKVKVTLQESRPITSLKVPKLRTDYKNALVLTENEGAVIDRLNARNVIITYTPDEETQRRASEEGISGQFVVQYDVERELGGGEIQVVDGYFVHFFAPSGLNPVPKNVMFVLDVSGSMSGDKIEQVKLAMNTILNDLRSGDKFNILLFSDSMNYWNKEEMEVVNEDSIERAKTFIQDMSAGGGTNINDGLIYGVDFLREQSERESENRPTILIFLTDGQPSSGVTNTATIMMNVRDKNQGASALFTLGFGNDVDFPFLTKLSLQNDGFARKIYIDADPSLQLQDFYAEVSTPVLSDVSIRYLGDTVDPDTVTDTDFSTYFMGSEIVIAGKLKDDEVSNVISQVSGQASSGYVEMDLSANVAKMEALYRREHYPRFTEKLWAYLTIRKLLDAMISTMDDVVKEKSKQRALELSLKYGFVTPLTSMVVTKPEVEEELEAEDEDKQAVPSQASPQNRAAKLARAPKRSRSRPQSFVDNDPHFVVKVKGVEEGVCFDVNGDPGDIFQLLYDKHNDIVVNGEVNAPSLMPQNTKHVPTYFSHIVLSHAGQVIRIGPRLITINLFQNITWKNWRNSKPILLKDITMILTAKNHLLVKIGDSIEFVLLRHVSNIPNPRKMDYLGFYVSNGEGLDNKCHGLLGQFASIEAWLSHPTVLDLPTTLKYKANTPIRVLNINDPHSSTNKRNVLAFLGKRRNMDAKEHVACWHIRNNGRGLISGHFSQYKVPHLRYDQFALTYNDKFRGDLL